MIGPYDIGQTVKLTATITDDTRKLYDPATVAFEVLAEESPSIVTPSVNRVDVGLYTAQVVLTVGGRWWYRVNTTGPDGGAERTFYVNPSRFS